MGVAWVQETDGSSDPPGSQCRPCIRWGSHRKKKSDSPTSSTLPARPRLRDGIPNLVPPPSSESTAGAAASSSPPTASPPPHLRILVRRQRRTRSRSSSSSTAAASPTRRRSGTAIYDSLCRWFGKLSQSVVVSVNHRRPARLEHQYTCAPPTGPDLQAGELSNKLECSSATIVSTACPFAIPCAPVIEY